ncbi:MAG: acyl-CoA dehydrogenase [Deltaproteobacteria bacterium]|nr:MAG: acyl-CoA dehydrogenase [Deltaproteobacteria bacterium]
MRAAFTEDQLTLAEAVRTALQAECNAEALRRAWTETHDFWPLLAEQGVLALSAPESLGGMGMGALDWVNVAVEAGKVALPAPLGEHLAIVELLAEAGHGELVEAMTTGEARVSAAFAGDAEKTYAVNHGRGEAVVVLGPAQATLVRQPVYTTQATADQSLQLASVDGDGESLDGDAARAFDRAVLANAAQLLGVAETILDLAVEYAKARRQFGKPIGSFQAVQHHLVDALLKRRFAAPVVHRAAHSLDTDDPRRSVHVSMAKIYAAEAAELACRKSLQVHGAIGYTFEYDLHLYMKRAWALSAAWGSVAWHRDRVAATVLGDSHG